MKIVLFILIICGFTFIGFTFTKKYKERLTFYKDLNVFFNVLENQITFTKNSLASIAQKHSLNFNPKFKKVLSDVLINKKKYENIDILTVSENSYIDNLFQSLGKSDVNGEVLNIKNNKSEIQLKIDECLRDNNRFGSLGVKLGFILGLLVCIILI